MCKRKSYRNSSKVSSGNGMCLGESELRKASHKSCEVSTGRIVTKLESLWPGDEVVAMSQ